MTVLELIHKKTLEALTLRLDTLKSFGSPKIVIDNEEAKLNELKKNSIKIKGDEDLLRLEYRSHDYAISRGQKGHMVIETNGGKINYFPDQRLVSR